MGREIHVRSHPSPIEHWRHLVEIAALIAAAAWAIYVFIYQEDIKPQNELPHFQPTVIVHHDSLAGGNEFVKVEFHLNNVSRVPISLAGIVVNVYGRKFGDKSGERIEVPLAGVSELNRTLVMSPQRLLYSYYDVWRPFGAPKDKAAELPAGRDFVESFAFGIKQRSFDLARVTYVICYSRPGDSSWPVYRQRLADGAYNFGGIELRAPNAGLFCGGQRRGEYFGL